MKRIALALLLVSLIGCRRSSPPVPMPGPPTPRTVPTPAPSEVIQGLTEDDRYVFHHLAIGSEIMPLAWLQVLKSPKTGQPFLQNPERFGMLADPESELGLPIGVTAGQPRFAKSFGEMAGLNCAICHVVDLEYNGEVVRIEGAPSLVNLDVFFGELAEAIGALLKDPKELFAFVARAQHQRSINDEGLHATEHQQFFDEFQDLNSLRDSGELEAAFADQIEEELASEVARPLEGEEASDGGLKSRALDRLKGVLAKRIGEKSRLKRIADREQALRESLGRVIHATHLLKQRIAFLKKMKELKAKGSTATGPGRADTWVLGRNGLFDKQHALPATSPSSFPHLWGYADLEWLTWNGCTTSGMHRDVGTALGLGAFFDLDTFESTVLPSNLHEADLVTEKISAPKWPDEFGSIDEEKRDRGQQLYVQHCAKRHDSPADYPIDEIGTDPNLAVNFDTPVGERRFVDEFTAAMKKFADKSYEATGNTLAEGAELEKHRPEKWRSERVYVSRPLVAIWATAPYLHNGSVPTLYDLLLPATERPATFHLGHRDYDPVKLGYETQVEATPVFNFDASLPGNSNQGHEYGTELSHDQRMDLLEYLKST